MAKGLDALSNAYKNALNNDGEKKKENGLDALANSYRKALSTQKPMEYATSGRTAMTPSPFVQKVTNATRMSAMDMAIDTVRNSVVGKRMGEWAKNAAETYTNHKQIKDWLRNTPEGQKYLIDYNKSEEERQKAEEIKRRQDAITLAQDIDVASSLYEPPTKRELVKVKDTNMDNADMFSNDWEPVAGDEHEEWRTVQNERYNPLAREERDALIDSYYKAMMGGVDSETYHQIMVDVAKNGGIQQLVAEQKADADNDRDYFAKLNYGINLDDMNTLQRTGRTFANLISGTEKQWLGQQMAGIETMVTPPEAMSAKAQTETFQADRDRVRDAAWDYVSALVGRRLGGVNEQEVSAARNALNSTVMGDYYLTDETYDPNLEMGDPRNAAWLRVADQLNAVADRIAEGDSSITKDNILDFIQGGNLSEQVKRAFNDDQFQAAYENLLRGGAEDLDLAKAYNPIAGGFGDMVIDAASSSLSSAQSVLLSRMLLGGAISGVSNLQTRVVDKLAKSGAAKFLVNGAGFVGNRIQDILGMAAFGTGAYGASANEARQKMLEQGIDIGLEEARKIKQYAAANTGIELGSEMMFSSIGTIKNASGSSIFNGFADEFERAFSGFLSTPKGAAAMRSLGRMLGGGIEEGLEEVVGDLVRDVCDVGGLVGDENKTTFEEYVKDFLVGAMSGLMGETSRIVTSPMQQSKLGRQLKEGSLDISLNELADLANSEGMENTTLAKAYSDIFHGLPRNIESISDLEAGKLYEAYEKMLGSRSEAINHIEKMQAKLDAGKRLTRSDVNRITNNNDAVAILSENGTVSEDAFKGGINERRDAVEMALRAFANDSAALSETDAENVQSETENANTAVSAPNPFLTMSNSAIDNIVRNAQPMSPAQSIRESNASNMLAGNVLRSAARVVDAAERLNVSERGQDVMARMYSPNMDAIDYVGEMTKYYNQGKEGKTFDVSSIEGVSAIQAQAAFNAGRQEYIERSNNGEEGLRVRTSSEWQNGQSAGGPVGVLEESAGTAQGRQIGSFQREGSNARVSAESLRTEGAKAIERSGLRIVTNDSSVAAAKKYAEDRGVNFVAYAGGALNIDGVQSRGYYDSDTNTVYVRADHRLFTAEQIAKHETTHAQIHSGKITLGEVDRETVDFATVRDALVNELGQERFDEMVDAYVEMYAGTNLSRQEVFEELICDSVAGMNDFVSVGHLENAVKFAPSMSKAKAIAEAQEANGTRAGPTDNSSLGRRSIDLTADALGVDAYRDEAGKVHFRVDGREVKKITAEHVKNNSAIGVLIKAGEASKFITAKEAEEQYKAAADLMNMIMSTQDPEMIWAFSGATMFSALKKNSDGQYGTTIDFTTVCRKTQEMVTAMSNAMREAGRGLTKKEVTDLQHDVLESGAEVPCPVCYVFSRWAGIGGMLDDIVRLQDKYAKFTKEQITARTNELKKEIIARGLGSKDKKGRPTVTGSGATALMKELEAEANDAKAKIEWYEDGKKGAVTEAEYKRLKKELPAMQENIGILSEWTWASQIVTREDYKPVPKDILFDLDAGEKFADIYAAVWKYRTTRGPSSGKAILPYSSMRTGDIITGAEPSATVRALFTDKETNKSKMRGKMTKKQNEAYQKAVLRTAAQNLIGGQRYQSTSDFRYEYALDYIQSFWELQALGSKLQTYTKVVEYADIIAAVGGDVNLSVMPLRSGVENGKLIFSNQTGMNIGAALEANRKFDNAQLILVGINDEHILAALDDHHGTGGENIGFVIPYHASGASITDFISELVKNLGERFVNSNYRDYSAVQNDKEKADRTAEQIMRAEIRKKLLTGKTGVRWNKSNGAYESNVKRNELTKEELDLIRGKSVDISGRTFEDLRNVELKALAGDKAAIREYLSWSAGVLNDLYEKMYNGAEKDTVLNSSQAEHIMPHEYWNTNTTRANAYVNGFIFRSYCYSMGLMPRFSWTVGSGENAHGDLSGSDGYWKTLIDRPMYNNDGTYRAQQRINVTDFNNAMLKPSYAEKTYPKYKIQEPNRSRAEKVGTEFGKKISGKLSRDLDSAYMAAAESGDTETAQRFVDEAAKAAGYTVKAYHGTHNFGRTKFNADWPTYLTSKPGTARAFSGGVGPRSLSSKNSVDSMTTDELISAAESSTYMKNIKRATKEQIDDEYRRYNDYGKSKIDSARAKGEPIFRWSDDNYNDGIVTLSEIKADLNEVFNNVRKGGTYTFYVNPGDALTVYGDGAYYTSIPVDGMLAETLGKRTASTDEILKVAADLGFDSVIYKDIAEGGDYGRAGRSDVYAVVRPDINLKSADPITYDEDGNIIPLSERFNSENDDIRYSRDLDSAGNQLTKAQAEYFKDSKVRDENGNLLVMYHGTDADFNIFDFQRGGEHGAAEGFGIYLADDRSISEHYGGRIIESYANITRPARSDSKTIKSSELTKLIKASCLDEAKRIAEDYGGKVTDALRDTWVSNYVYTYDKSMDAVYREVANNILRLNDNDMDIVQEVMAGMAIRTYDAAMAFYNDILTPTTGIDGFVTHWSEQGSDKKHLIALAFNSNQVKNTDNQNPTENPDIRFSRDLDSAGNKLTEQQAEYFANSTVRDSKGRLKVVYHGTTAQFNTFKRGDIGFHFGNKSTARTRVGRGKNTRLIEAYLNITNPIVFDEDLGSWDADYRLTQELFNKGIITKEEGLSVLRTDSGYKRSSGDANNKLRSLLESKGYDGITYPNSFESSGSTSYIAFESNQAKLTTNENPTDNADVRFSRDLSSAYMAAAESGDTETAAKLVKQAAEAAGYTVEGYHGTEEFGFTKIDTKLSDDKFSFFVTNDLNTARTYSTKSSIRKISDKELGQEEAVKEQKQAYEEARSSAIDFATVLSQMAGIQGWADVQNITNELEQQVANFEDDFAHDIETFHEELWGYLDQLTWDLFDFTHEDMQGDIEAYEEWFDSDEVQSLRDAYENVSAAYTSYATLEESNENAGNYHVYINPDGIFTINCKGKHWDSIDGDGKAIPETNHGRYWNTRTIARWAKDNGYAGVLFQNVIDDGGKGGKRASVADVYALFNPQAQVKSADPITYDDAGNIIPLEERFNSKNDDIRYSRDLNSDGKQLTKGQQEFFKDSQARDEQGRLLVLYHGTPNAGFNTFKPGITWLTTSKRDADAYSGNPAGKLYDPDEDRSYSVRVATIADLVAHPRDFKMADIERAFDAYDQENAFGEEDYTKADYIEALKQAIQDDPETADIEFRTESKRGTEDTWIDSHRTYELYANATNPMVVDLHGNAMHSSWENGYRYVDAWKDSEYDSLIIKNTKVGKYQDPATLVLVRNSNQVALTTNENPTSDPDIRFSRDLSNTELYESNRQLQKDLTELRSKLKTRTEQRDYWRRQTQKTEDVRLKQDVIKNIAKEVIKTNNSKADQKAVAEKLNELGNILLQTDNENWYDDARMKCYEIAHMVNESAEVLDQRGGEHFYKDFRDALKQAPIYVAPSVREEVAPDGWNDFRKAQFGTVNMTADQNKGKSVDTVYHDLQATFGEWLLPEYVTSEADQLNKILEVVETYRPIYENMNSYEMAEANEWVANEILTRTMELMEIGELRQEDSTRADIARERLNAEKQKSAEALTQVRQQRDRKVADLKAHYQQAAEDRRNRKIDSEMRSRLLKIAKRLNNKKLDRVTRGLLDQYIGELDLVSKGILGRTVKELETLQAWYDSYKESMGDDFIPDKFIERKIARLSKKHISDLTQEEVADLTTVLLNLETMIRTQNQLIESQIKMDAYAAGVQTIDDINNSNGRTGFLNKYISTETATPEREIHRITGYRDSSPLYNAAKELSDGQRKMLDYQRRAEALFKKWTTEKKFIRRIAGKHAEEITVSGYVNGQLTDVKITPAMRMALYLHEKNDDNMRHISKGGVKIPDMALYKKGKLQEAYDKATRVVFTRGMLKEIASKMSADEKAFADAVDRYYNGMSRNEINDTSEALRGYAIAGVEHYYPIDTDGSFLKKEFDAIKRDGSIEGMGILKERIEGATNPIMLYDMNDTLNRSISQHSKYVGLAIPVRNFNKLYGVTTHNYETSVAETLKKNWGSAATSYIEKMMADVQNGTGLKSDAWGDLLARARSKYAGAVLNTNASVAMKQAASYPTAAAVVGYGPLMRALADVKKIDLDKLAQYTPLLWYRSKGFSTTELGDIGKEGGHIPKALNWIQAMDVATTTKLAKAAMYYVNENNNLTRGTDAWWKAVAEVYNRIIEETQPNYTMMQRPQILRSDNALTRALNMFKTQPFQNFNILYDAFGNLAAKSREYKANASAENLQALKSARTNVARAVSSQAVSTFVFALMQFAWDAFRGKAKKYKDDDDEMTLASWLKGMGINVLSSAGGMIPFGSYVLELGETMTDAILKAFKLDPFFDQTFYGLSENASSSVNDMGKAMINMVTKISQTLSGGEVTESTVRSVVDSMGDIAQFAGIPVNNVIKLAQSIGRNIYLAAEGRYVGGYHALRLTTDPARYSSDYYDLLWKAYNNDKAAYDEVLQLMLDDGFEEDKIKSAMEKRMKDAQGVSSVKDLESRWMAPSQQKTYDEGLADLEKTTMFQAATDEQQKALLTKLYNLALDNDAGKKLNEKIAGGADVGLEQNEYLLYTLALSMVDKPTESGKYGSYTNDEVEAAILMVPGLSKEERAYLWDAAGKAAKSNPWR